MSFVFRRLGPSELLPRYVFAEHLLVRRRVLELGAVAATRGESAKFLLARGARSVLACDDVLEAVAEAQRTLANNALRFRSAVFDDLESGSFDLVLVTDLAAYVRAPLLLKELARLVSPHGFLLGGLRNPAGLALSQVSDPEDGEPPPTYGQLLDALQPHFKEVEVATQSPLLGYQLALESAEGLQVDGSLAGSAEAAYFVVLAGQEPPPPSPPTWVQLPPAPLAYASGRLEEFAHRAKGWEERHGRVKEAWEKARHEADAREVALVQLRGELERTREELARTLAQLELRERNAAAQREGDELAQKVRRLEAELQVSRERAEDAEGRVAVARGEFDTAADGRRLAEAQALAAQESARLERAKREELLSQLSDSRERAAQAYEAARRYEDAAAGARLELERATLREGQAVEALRVKALELMAARERELALAAAHSAALSAVESLRRELAEAREASDVAAREGVEREADLELARRAAEAEAQARGELELRLRELTREEEKLRSELETQLRQLSTELAGALDERASLEAQVARHSDAQALASSLEARLEEMREAASAWERRAEELASHLDAERARASGLEGLREVAEQADARAREAVAQREAEQARADLLEGSQESARQWEEQAQETAAQLEEERARAARLEQETVAFAARERTLQAQLQAAEVTAIEERSGREAADVAVRQLRDERVALAENLARAEAERFAVEELSAGWERKLGEALTATRIAQAAEEQARLREATLEQVAQAAEAARAHAVRDLESVREQSDERSREAARWQTEITVRDEERLQLAQQRETLEVTLSSREVEHAQLLQERDRLLAQVDNALSQAERSSREAEEKEKELQRTLETLKLFEDNRARERSEWEHKIQGLSARVAAAETSDQERDRLIAQLQTEERERGEMKKQLDEALAVREGLQEQVEKLEAETLRLLAEAHREKTGHEKAEGELERLRAALKEAAAEHNRKQTEMAEAQSREGEWTERLRALEDERGARAADLAQAQEELDQLKRREADLAAKLEEKESRWDVMQRRLSAQESELVALRRVAGRASASNQVQQIYERANAELTAVKAELFHKRPPTNPGGTPQQTSEPAKGDPPPPLPGSGKKTP